MQADAMGLQMMVDATITVGNMIEIGVLAVGGLVTIVTIRGTVGNMKADLTEMKADIKKFGEVLVTLAIAGQRLTSLEQDVRELRHGRGFVQARSEGGINGEYP